MSTTTDRRASPTDLTDAQWALLEPWLSARAWTGRPRTVALREVVNAVFYLLRTGCQWRHLPHDFPPWCTVRYYYDLWQWNGTWVRINTALCAADRERRGRGAQPRSACSWYRRTGRRPPGAGRCSRNSCRTCRACLSSGRTRGIAATSAHGYG